MTQGHALARRFFPGTATSYEFVVNVFTLGLDRYWKRQMLRSVDRATRVLDLACGTGIVTRRVHRKFPQAQFIGVDLTSDYLSIYEQQTRASGISAQAILADAESVELEGFFDLVISSYLPKYVDADRLMTRLTPHLSSGGRIVLHDFALPSRRVWRWIWRRYNSAMNGIGMRLMPMWREVFSGELTGLIEETDWVYGFEQALSRHGYEDVKIRHLSLGSACLITALKK